MALVVMPRCQSKHMASTLRGRHLYYYSCSWAQKGSYINLVGIWLVAVWQSGIYCNSYFTNENGLYDQGAFKK